MTLEDVTQGNGVSHPVFDILFWWCWSSLPQRKETYRGSGCTDSTWLHDSAFNRVFYVGLVDRTTPYIRLRSMETPHTQLTSSFITLQRWRSSLKHTVFNLSHCPVIGSTVSSVLPVCRNGRLDSIKTNVCQMLRPGNELVFLGRGFFLVTVVQVAQHVCYLHGSWRTGSLDNSVCPDKCCIRCFSLTIQLHAKFYTYSCSRRGSTHGSWWSQGLNSVLHMRVNLRSRVSEIQIQRPVLIYCSGITRL